MRRLLAAASAAAALVSALPGAAHAATNSAGGGYTTLSAIPADSLVDSYGVGVHLGFLDTPYKETSKVADALVDLGVRHVRDDLFLNDPQEYAAIDSVAARGIRFDLIAGNPNSSPASDYVQTIATQIDAGAVESIEGPNEWDYFSHGANDWAAALTARQRELYAAVHANAATAKIPVLGPALAFRWNYSQLGDLSPYADEANAHMYPGGYQPSNEMAKTTAAVRTVIPTKPLVTTEAGYHNAVNTTNGHLPVPEDVAGVYAPRVLLEHELNGDSKVYTYELLDEQDEPGATNPEAHFGLLRHDFSPKPAFTAMKNLLALVSDPGASFAPHPLSLRASGWPSDGKVLLVQKRNGQYVLLLWRDVSVYDPVTKQRQAVTPTNVTLQFTTPMAAAVYRPSQQSAAVAHTSGSSVRVALDGAVTALTLSPVSGTVATAAGTQTQTALQPSATSTSDAGVATQGVVPAAVARPARLRVILRRGHGIAKAQLSWRMPAGDASLTGFRIRCKRAGIDITLPSRMRSHVFRLRPGRTYVFSMRALSGDAESSAVASRRVDVRHR